MSKKDKQYNVNKKKDTWQTMIYKAMQRKQKIEKHRPHEKPSLSSDAQER
jgi:hypothetical protein